MRPSPIILPTILLALLLTAPLVTAQDAQRPVLVESVTSKSVELTTTTSAKVAFSLYNLNSQSAFFVTVGAEGLDEWDVATAPNRFFLEPRNQTEITVTFAPVDHPSEHTDGAVVFSFVSSETGAVFEVRERVTLRVTDAALVLDLFANPLPPPLDNAYGVFLLDLAFWAIAGFVSFLAGDTVVRHLTRFARDEVTRVIIHKLRWPVFFFVLLLGLRQSFDVLPRNGFTVFVQRFLTAAAVGIVGIYVAYRIVDSALYYYKAEVAARTATRLDDALVPALRKISVVTFFAVGFGYVLSVFGFDPRVLFGAAGIAGLVIAFAAQDTLSNFFSGIFLLLDRPFLEGDDIQIETGEVCRVESVGLRSTRLYHYRNHEIVVLPNNQLASKRVVNLAGPDRRYAVNLDFGVSYDTDVDHLREVAVRVARETPGVHISEDREPVVLFTAYGDSSINFILRIWVEDFRQRFGTAFAVRERLFKALKVEGIEIPFPQRVLHIPPVEGGGSPLEP